MTAILIGVIVYEIVESDLGLIMVFSVSVFGLTMLRFRKHHESSNDRFFRQMGQSPETKELPLILLFGNWSHDNRGAAMTAQLVPGLALALGGLSLTVTPLSGTTLAVLLLVTFLAFVIYIPAVERYSYWGPRWTRWTTVPASDLCEQLERIAPPVTVERHRISSSVGEIQFRTGKKGTEIVLDPDVTKVNELMVIAEYLGRSYSDSKWDQFPQVGTVKSDEPEEERE